MDERGTKGLAIILSVFTIGVLFGAAVSTIILANPVFFTRGCSFQPYITPSSESELVSMIENAHDSVYVECYLLTNDKIIESIIGAKRRGLDVRVLLDPTVEENADAFLVLSENGVPVKWSSQHFTRTHAKMVLVDKSAVFIGSSNLTYHGFHKNRETNVIISGCNVSIYVNTFEEDWKAAG